MAALPFVGQAATPAIVAVIGFGLGFGVGSIAKPVLLADRYDTRRYATIAGVLVVPITIAKATAPLAAAWLHTSARDTVARSSPRQRRAWSPLQRWPSCHADIPSMCHVQDLRLYQVAQQLRQIVRRIIPGCTP